MVYFLFIQENSIFMYSPNDLIVETGFLYGANGLCVQNIEICKMFFIRM